MKTMILFSEDEMENIVALLNNAIFDAESLDKERSSYRTDRLVGTLHRMQLCLKEDKNDD